MGGCQNYGPFLGTLTIRCRIIIGIQKGAIILTTTHIAVFSPSSYSTFDMQSLNRISGIATVAPVMSRRGLLFAAWWCGRRALPEISGRLYHPSGVNGAPERLSPSIKPVASKPKEGKHGAFPKLGYLFGGACSKDSSILGSTLGSYVGVPLLWETATFTAMLLQDRQSSPKSEPFCRDEPHLRTSQGWKHGISSSYCLLTVDVGKRKILGLYRDNGKENGNYYILLAYIWGSAGNKAKDITEGLHWYFIPSFPTRHQ